MPNRVETDLPAKDSTNSRSGSLSRSDLNSVVRDSWRGTRCARLITGFYEFP